MGTTEAAIGIVAGAALLWRLGWLQGWGARGQRAAEEERWREDKEEGRQQRQWEQWEAIHNAAMKQAPIITREERANVAPLRPQAADFPDIDLHERIAEAIEGTNLPGYVEPPDDKE